MVAPSDPKGINTASSPGSIGRAIDSWGFVFNKQQKRRVVLALAFFIGGGILIFALAFLLIRLGGNNLHANDTAGFVRSAELDGPALADAIAVHKIRSVLRLVGTEGSDAQSYQSEREVCEKLGVRHFVAKMAATRLPYRSEIQEVFLALDAIELDPNLQPVLIHCSAGSDRTGLVSAIWLHDYRGASLETARQQLAWVPYMHVSMGAAGAMGDFLDQYESFVKANPRQNLLIKDWVKQHYFEEKPGRQTKPWLDGNVYRP